MTTPAGGSRPFAEPRSWRHRGRAALTERVGLKLAALGMAVLLWLVVGARQPTESWVDVRVVPQLDRSLALADATPVRALVAGRAADIVKLYATPLLIRRRIDGRSLDSLTVDLSPSDVHVPPELSDALRVLEVQPHDLTLRFERATARTRARDCTATAGCR